MDLYSLAWGLCKKQKIVVIMVYKLKHSESNYKLLIYTTLYPWNVMWTKYGMDSHITNYSLELSSTDTDIGTHEFLNCKTQTRRFKYF